LEDKNKMAKLKKRLGKGFWTVKESSDTEPIKRKVYRAVSKDAKIERWVIINNKRVKVEY